MPQRRQLSWLCVLVLNSLLTACGGSPASVVSQPNPGVAPLAPATVSLAHIFAPYVYMGQSFSLAQNATAVSRFYILAFVLDANARTCAATWNGTTPINAGLEQNDIANLRAAGGDVILSFGGYDGYELAQDCPNAADLEAQYQMAMRQYGVRSLDFDIEYGPSGALTDQASIELRNQALAALQAVNPRLQISYTLPVTVQGLTPEDIFLLDNAVSQHVHLTAVNLMTMDYGYAEPQERSFSLRMPVSWNSLPPLTASIVCHSGPHSGTSSAPEA